MPSPLNNEQHCNECKDNFCTPCYRDTHATGTRKKHTTTPLGPVDCGECENVLAERWCVTCDEAHCDGCWRKLHGRGKRRFHPFCKVNTHTPHHHPSRSLASTLFFSPASSHRRGQVWPGGKIGEAVTTIDGRVVSDADRVDPAFLQRRMDQEAAGEVRARAQASARGTLSSLAYHAANAHYSPRSHLTPPYPT